MAGSLAEYRTDYCKTLIQESRMVDRAEDSILEEVDGIAVAVDNKFVVEGMVELVADIVDKAPELDKADQYFGSNLLAE